MVIALIGSMILVVLADMRGLLKSTHKTKTMIVYFFLIFVGFVISLLQIIDIVSLTPSDIIEDIVDFALGR